MARTGPAFRASTRGQVLLTGFMLALLALTVAPLYWLVMASTHSSHEIFTRPPKLLPGSDLGANLSHLQSSVGFGRVVFNSIALAVCYTLLGGVVCTLAGYGFAKYSFRGRGFLFSVLLLALVVPTQLTIVPLFKMMVDLGWLNTYQAVLLPNLALPFGIFLMRQSMKSLPDELLQAGRIDGCGELSLFFRIALPTMRPALAALAMFLFLFQWNDFLWPLVVLRDPSSYTIPVALATLTGSSDVDYGQLLTGTAVSAVPMAVLFLFLQKHFVSGMLAGAVKA
ncbi:carbohydrate ABC transporter permease [Kitasatospora viridis]|uniref:Carbohydrate ABC transporter membrane protein 2 (CUT1 family) n=1 Tax=Kitasatospora viridis TaxID=281105 RepID=A0A561UQG8_9ACTN|nr:carbohydrate ABC transporter permease [Kitasatospora viridis]TWG01600.1 carbohydrate ABC transporter membrane protein 2 (CUT1 family) [Kitasatospora viridis]